MTTAIREACRRGHSLTPENTYLRPGGWRECRTYKAAHAAKYRPHRADRTPALPRPWKDPDTTKGSLKPIVKLREVGAVRALTDDEVRLALRLIDRLAAHDLIDALGLADRASGGRSATPSAPTPSRPSERTPS